MLKSYEVEMTGFPVSIGTGYALETLFDTVQDVYDAERPKAKRVNINNYDVFMVNVATLFRNIVSAIPKEALGDKGVLKVDRALSNLESEMQYITDICHYNSDAVAIFYTNEPEKLASKHKNAMIKVAKTELQIKTQRAHEEMIRAISKEALFKRFNIKHYTGEIKPKQKKKVLMLTHMPYDLLSIDNFTSLELIESNTGVVRSPLTFNHKLHMKKDGVDKVDVTQYMPFNIATIQIFGDDKTFMPFNKEARANVMALARRCNWKPNITVSKFSSDVSKLNDKFLASIIHSMVDERL